MRLAWPFLTRRVSRLYEVTYLEPLLRSDPWLGWSGRPNASARIESSSGELVDYSLNASGWRDESFDPLNRAGNALSFGDAYAFGQGVPVGSRYTDVLERSYRGLAIWDLGVPGYAPDQLMIQAERWLPPEPWVFAILQLSPEGPALAAEHEWRGVHSITGTPSSIGASLSLGRSGSSAALNLLAELAEGRSALPPPDRLAEGLRRSLFAVREIGTIAKERKIPLITLEAGDWGAVKEYRDGVAALAKELNFALVEAGAQETLPAPDRHWSAAAHARVAQLLSAEVNKILFAPKKLKSR